MVVTALTDQNKLRSPGYVGLHTNIRKFYDDFLKRFVTFIVTEKLSLEGTELWGIVTLTPGNSVTVHVKASGESL